MARKNGMRILPIAIALLLTSVFAFSQDRWKLVLEDKSEKVYLDTTSVEKTAQGYLVCTRTVFPKPISIPQAGKGKPLAGVVSFVNRVEYTMHKQQSRHRWFYNKRGVQLWDEDVIGLSPN